MSLAIILLVIFVIIVFWLISLYNQLVRLRNNRENAFADIDVQLKQRHDLIPQLVNAVKGYMQHEEGVLTKITEARSRAIKAEGIDAKILAEKDLTSALGGFNVAVEAYPDLKANTNFLQLQEEMADIENKLASVRRYFNSATKELNNSVQMFPSNIVAGMFGFIKEPFFDLGEKQRDDLDTPPEVKF
jgi:LemA protein